MQDRSTPLKCAVLVSASSGWLSRFSVIFVTHTTQHVPTFYHAVSVSFLYRNRAALVGHHKLELGFIFVGLCLHNFDIPASH